MFISISSVSSEFFLKRLPQKERIAERVKAHIEGAAKRENNMLAWWRIACDDSAPDYSFLKQLARYFGGAFG
jgi:hypothetical protein